MYTVNVIPLDRSEGASVAIMARRVGDYAIIEDDTTDKPLLDALLVRGVPRAQIILAYLDEVTPA